MLQTAVRQVCLALDTVMNKARPQQEGLAVEGVRLL